jgi:hypothetical protein
MLKRLLAIAVLAGIPLAIFLIYKINYGSPHVDDIVQDVGIRLPASSELAKFELLEGGLDIAYIANFTFESGGEEICSENKFDRYFSPLPSLGVGQRGYRDLLGTGICHGVKDFTDRVVFFVVNEKQIKILVIILWETRR